MDNANILYCDQTAPSQLKYTEYLSRNSLPNRVALLLLCSVKDGKALVTSFLEAASKKVMSGTYETLQIMENT